MPADNIKDWLRGYQHTQPYSGRGMFGKQCMSLVADSIPDGLSMITRDVFDEGDEDLMVEWIELIKETKHDQLGHGYVLYWPEVGV